MGKYISELSALNAEARERHISYGQLMAKTTPQERERIIEKWRNHYTVAQETEAKELLDRFQELYDRGLSDAAIGAECGCSAGKVIYWRRKRGLTSNRERNRYDKQEQ